VSASWTSIINTGQSAGEAVLTGRLRFDYGEPRFVTVGMLDSRLVVFVWTPRGSARRIISMRHCHEREAKRLRPYFTRDE
jgi:uncharacterized DUF497 family protein